MAKKQQEPERKVYVTIRSGGKKERFESWRYWEIIGALQWMGADGQTAYDAAKWAGKAKPGDIYRIEKLTDDLALVITMEVSGE